MNTIKRLKHFAAISSLPIVSIAAVAHADPIVVSPSNMNGWSFLSSDVGDVGQLVPGPIDATTPFSGPPLGIGSAELATAPGHGDGASQIVTSNYAGTPLADLTSLSYFTYDTINNGQQFPYLKVNVSTSGPSGPIDDQLFFEPPYQTPAAGGPGVTDQGPTVMDKWQSWNALQGAWWDNNGILGTGGFNQVGSLNSFLALYPNATIEVDPSLGYAMSLRVGFASSTDNFDGNVDAFTIGSNAAGTTTYDFEPNAVPEPASLSLVGIGALGLLRRRRRA